MDTMSIARTAVAPSTTPTAPKGATVEELERAPAAVGSTARDVIAILQALHAAGALEADSMPAWR
jgi:flagellar basal body P-ring protein FlgI